MNKSSTNEPTGNTAAEDQETPGQGQVDIIFPEQFVTLDHEVTEIGVKDCVVTLQLDNGSCVCFSVAHINKVFSGLAASNHLIVAMSKKGAKKFMELVNDDTEFGKFLINTRLVTFASFLNVEMVKRFVENLVNCSTVIYRDFMFGDRADNPNKLLFEIFSAHLPIVQKVTCDARTCPQIDLSLLFCTIEKWEDMNPEYFEFGVAKVTAEESNRYFEEFKLKKTTKMRVKIITESFDTKAKIYQGKKTLIRYHPSVENMGAFSKYTGFDFAHDPKTKVDVFFKNGLQ